MFEHERMVADILKTKRAIFSGVALLVAAGIISSAPASAQSNLAGSSWPAFRHDALMTAFAPAQGPASPEVKWKAEFGSGPLGSPVLAVDGTIYVPGNADNALYAVTPDGKPKWVFVGSDTGKFVAPPIIGQEGTIYLGSTSNILYAVNPNGTERWRRKLGGPIRFSANLGGDGTIYVAANDCILYAITPAGNIKWKVFLGKLPGNGPAIATDGTIYVVAGEFLKGFRPDGTLQPGFPVNCEAIGILNGLMVEGKELIYVTALEKPRVWAISNSGMQRWDFALPNGFGNPTMPAMGKDGTIYFAGTENGGVFALKHDGSGLRQPPFSLTGTKPLTELLVDGADYSYVVNDKEGLLSVSATGQLRWSLPEVKCAFSPAMGADGMIYVAGERKLYAVGQKLPNIAVLPNAIAFPKTCVNASGIDSSLVISNLGTADLEVTKIESSDTAFQIIDPPTPFVVKPGKTRAGKVKFTAAAAISYGGTISIFSNDLKKNPMVVNVSGSGGVADIDGLAEAVFDTVEVQTCANIVNFDDTTYVIRNLGVCNLNITGLIASGDFRVISPAVPAPVPANGSLNVVLRFTPKTEGRKTGILKIQSDDPNDPEMTVALRGLGHEAPDIDVAAKVVDFGKVPVGNSKRMAVIVKNLGADTLFVVGAEIMPSEFATESQEKFLLCGDSLQIPVAFSPKVAGRIDGKLLIRSNDPNENPLVVPVTGIGTVPDIAVMPDTLDFGAVCLGENKVLFVAVKNEGMDTLRVDSLKFSNPAFTSEHVKPFVLAPGASEKISVRFTPVTVGKKNEALSIYSDDLDENPVVVKLLAEGIGALIAIRTTPSDSGEVCLGQTGTTNVCVVNVGNCVLRVDSVKFGIIPLKPGLSKPPPFSFSRVFAAPLFLKPGEESCVFSFDALDQPNDFAVRVRVRSNAVNEDPASRLIHWKVTPPVIAGVDSVTFGIVKIGNSVQKTAQVSNLKSCEVRLDSLRIKGGTTSAFSLGAFAVPETLKAGEAANIPVIFKPAKPQGRRTDTLLVFNNDPKRNPLKLPLSGVGIDTIGSCDPQIAVHPNSLPFGTVCIGEDSARIVKICNTGTCNLVAISINTGKRQFKVTPNSNLLIPTGSDSCRQLTVTFSPDGVGVFADTVTVVWDASLNLPPLKIPLSGTGIGPRIAGTDTLRFSGVIEKQSLTKHAVVKNIAGCELVISALKVVGKDSLVFLADASGLPITLAAGASDSIAVTFTPPRPGSFMATLLVTNNDAGHNPFDIVLLGEGVACPPVIAVDPTALPFGEVVLGNVLMKTIKVTNTSACQTLHVYNVNTNAPAPFFVDSTDMQFDLAPGASRNVKVGFAPTAAVFYTDSVKIKSDDPVNGVVIVPLDGSGKLPYTAMPNPLIFPKVCVGSKDSLLVTICNLGRFDLVANSITTAGPEFREELDELLIPTGSDSCRTILIFFKPEAVGRFQDTLKVVWAPSLNLPPLKVPLIGEGIGPQISGNRKIDFGDVGIGNTRTYSDTVLNQSACVLHLDKVEITGKDTSDFHLVNFDPKNLPIYINPNGHVFLFVEFAPKAPGARTALLNIWSNDPDSTDKPFVVQLNGNGVTGLLALCDSLDFGKTCAGNAVTKECTLTNTSRIADAEIIKLQLASGKDFHFADSISLPIILKPQASRTVRITFDPAKTGPKRDANDKLLILTKFAERERSTALLGHKKAEGPELVLLTEAIEFEGALGIKTDWKPARILNDGCSALEVNDLKLAGWTPNAFELHPDTPKSFTLAPEEKKDVLVRFLPADYNEFKDELIIYSDDRDKNPAAVELLGRVPLGGICFDSDSTQIRFGRVFLSQEKTVAINLNNCSMRSAPALLRVEALPLALSDYSVAPTVVPNLTAEGSAPISITFRPQVTGERIDTLKLKVISVLSDDPPQVFTITLKGIGISDDVYALPNAFTPNCDGKNDRAKIHFPGYKMVAPVLRVYDLRGLLIRSLPRSSSDKPCTAEQRDDKTDARQDNADVIAWNGRDESNRLMLPGTYIWLLEDQGKKVGSGVIVLIR
jgi:outer membrane protein assembly factor BamB